MVSFQTIVTQEYLFEHLMKNSSVMPEGVVNVPSDEEDLRTISCVYAQGIRAPAGFQRVPKLIHFIWLGSRTISENSLANIQSWKNLHPGWKIRLWTDNSALASVPGTDMHMLSEIDFGPLKDFFETSDNFGEKADLLRYTLLYQQGGVYSDLDVFCKRSFDFFIERFDFVIGLEPRHYHRSINSCVIPANALIVAMPHHDILEQTIARIVSIWEEVGIKCPGKDRKSVFNRVIARTFDSMAFCSKKLLVSSPFRNIILPMSYFYSWKIFSEEEQTTLLKEGNLFAIHQSRPSGTFELSHDGSSWLPSTV
jgi:hypothetical protein